MGYVLSTPRPDKAVTDKRFNVTVVDKTTGFLTPRDTDYAVERLTSDKKLRILELYRNKPDLAGAARACEVNPATVYAHARNDPAFRKALDLIREEHTDAVESRVREYAERPSNFMDRMAWLRAHRADKWNPESKVRITHDRPSVEALYQDIQDAEVVTDAPVLSDVKACSNTVLVLRFVVPCKGRNVLT